MKPVNCELNPEPFPVWYNTMATYACSLHIHFVLYIVAKRICACKIIQFANSKFCGIWLVYMLGKFPSSVIDYILKQAHRPRCTVWSLHFIRLASLLKCRTATYCVFYYSVKWNCKSKRTGFCESNEQKIFGWVQGSLIQRMRKHHKLICHAKNGRKHIKLPIWIGSAIVTFSNLLTPKVSLIPYTGHSHTHAHFCVVVRRLTMK